MAGYAGIPPGPLSAYLGVREANRASGLQELGVLQRMQEAAEARKLRESLATQSDVRQRELAGMADVRSRELASMNDARAREFNASRLQQQQNVEKLTHEFRMGRLQSDADKLAETIRHNETMEGISKQIAEMRSAAGGAGKPSTEGERISAGYASRMSNSEKIIEDLTRQNKPGETREPITGTPGIVESMVATVPLVGKLGSNVARSPERQKYRQAQEDWVRAKLRKESGAVIADEEMDREIRVYFPQLGDSGAVIKQKKDSRKIAEDAMKVSAGTALGVVPGGGSGGVQRIKFDAQGNPVQ